MPSMFGTPQYISYSSPDPDQQIESKEPAFVFDLNLVPFFIVSVSLCSWFLSFDATHPARYFAVLALGDGIREAANTRNSSGKPIISSNGFDGI